MKIVVVVGLAASLGSMSGIAQAQVWQDATADCIGNTAGWTNKVEVADLDGDGLVDILMANGGNYDTPGSNEATRIWKNTGNWDTAGSHCSEISAQAIGGFTGLARAIKAADIDGDGDLDILTGGAYHTQLVLFKREAGGWVDATAQLPQQATSIGDIEFGDVDGDGDLDILLAEWGATDPGASNYQGGRTRLYLNDGSGNFTDVTATQMPDLLIGWSWDVELVDVDNDWDLDALVSCKLCTTSRLFRNDGTGHFTDDPDALPHHANNYEFEAMDIDGDGDLDLATINDGGASKNTLLLNDGTGTFTDVSAQLGNNPSADDNVVVWLDVDSDGDADLLVGSLGPDRLLLNDGSGHFTLSPNATPNDTNATLGLAAADLDGDGRLDLVQGQGEVAFSDKIQRATAMVAVDTQPPVVTFEQQATRVVARIHDHHSPAHLHDYTRVWAMTASGDVDLTWYGEYLYAAAATGAFAVCAIDAKGNQGCAGLDGMFDGAPGDDAGLPPIGQATGCCDANTRPSATIVPFALVLGAIVRRRRRR